MSELYQKKRRKSGSGRYGSEQKCLKEAGKAYKTRKLKNVAEKALPPEQGTYLMNLIHLGHIKRRRHGTYEDPVNSKRQVTIGYTIPTESGNFVAVCKSTFRNTFAVTRKKVDVLVAKKKAGETFYSDKRTCHKKSKFSENDREAIRTHINLIPRDVGHYTRTKSDKEYLSPDLNVNRLFRAFQKRNPGTAVTYKFYRSVFKKDFPKLSFRRPRMDTCHTCDRLDCEVRANIGTSAAAKAELELHQRRAERARDLLKKDTCDSVLPGSQLARYNPPFEVIKMTDFGFWDIKGPADLLLNTKKPKISKAVIIRIEKDNPINVKTKTAFSEIQQYTETNILKKGKTMSDLMKVELLGLPPANKISENKKKSLRSMLPYLSNPLHKDFYKELLDIPMD
ncbi:hypothetical protein JTB14_001818 [Gonioctena quinquepunctata]|nr:hypothetical protein JTB14_001818 [Gonioctena quinquepunctata]